MHISVDAALIGNRFVYTCQERRRAIAELQLSLFAVHDVPDVRPEKDGRPGFPYELTPIHRTVKLEQSHLAGIRIVDTVVVPPHVAVARTKSIDEIDASLTQILLHQCVVIQRYDVQLLDVWRFRQFKNQLQSGHRIRLECSNDHCLYEAACVAGERAQVAYWSLETPPLQYRACSTLNRLDE